jgi:hypothetical protein
MGLILLTERHAQQIAGVLSCYDRMIVQGTLPVFCYADGMTAYLSKRGIRSFHFIQFAKPLTDAIKANAEGLAAECSRNNTATSVPKALETPKWSSGSLAPSGVPTFLGSGYAGPVDEVGVVSPWPDYFVMDDVTYESGSSTPEPASLSLVGGAPQGTVAGRSLTPSSIPRPWRTSWGVWKGRRRTPLEPENCPLSRRWAR